MQRILALEIPAGTLLAKARDLFVFQMYTGFSYSDAQAFNINNYRKEKGKWVMVGERIKTGVPFVNQLLPPVVDVLERNGWDVPRLGNADYNHALKGLGIAAGLKVQLHSHMARHTFATFMLSNGVAIESVSKMLGHTNITQTQRYAKTLAKTVMDDFDRVAEKIKTSHLHRQEENQQQN